MQLVKKINEGKDYIQQILSLIRVKLYAAFLIFQYCFKVSSVNFKFIIHIIKILYYTQL